MTPKTTVESRGERYLPDLLLGMLPILVAFNCWGGSPFSPVRCCTAMPTSDNSMRPVTWSGPGTPANSMTSGAAAFQDALVGSDERALPFIRPAYQALSLFPFRCCLIAAPTSHFWL